MPEFDRHFLPPSVSIDGSSMLDDTIAFTLMSMNASQWSKSLPLALRLSYVLPYASYHETRSNWRPLFFAKYFALVENATSTTEAMSRLLPYAFQDWSGREWASAPPSPPTASYSIRWSSSTSPPVIDPLSFVAYGYGSCTAWATFITYLARAVGVPTRQAGTPCWNGGDFKGLAVDNSNVSLCWHGGLGSKDGTVGGKWLYNHNWVEYWDNQNNRWVYQNVPPGTATPNAGLCSSFSYTHGCNYDNVTHCDRIDAGPGAAMRDHEIFSPTWSLANDPYGNQYDGGGVVDVAGLALSNGTSL
eukprot:TRINITY_DN4337_c0_g1_i2.p1 TRINITY_DN4337_c0_g1~~TRINITY_DN4337_c0_g1_i2.p1  ORF type:complete len:302 (-),score=44.74 TRINITY_DN4337_c0_g1_i2:303-1208(-)